MFTGYKCDMLQWKQNCSLHERVLHISEEVQGVKKCNGSSKMSAPKTLGWQSIPTEAACWSWHGDCKGNPNVIQDFNFPNLQTVVL